MYFVLSSNINSYSQLVYGNGGIGYCHLHLVDDLCAQKNLKNYINENKFAIIVQNIL